MISGDLSIDDGFIMFHANFHRDFTKNVGHPLMFISPLFGLKLVKFHDN